MTSDRKFSVVIPVYNRAGRIGNAILSVLAQTYSNFEIIVVDDGSTDETKKAIQEFTDTRVNYIFQDNRERGAARNTGVREASGDYITFLDSDDEFFQNHLETVNRFILEHSQFDVFCTSYKIKSATKTTLLTMPHNIREKLIHENFLSCNGVFLPRQIAKEYHFSEDRAMSGLEDWELWLRIATEKTMIGNTDYTSQMNHHDERSVLQTTKENIEERFDSFYKHIFLNPIIVTYYRGKLRFLKASCETYMALHLALTKRYRAAAFKHLLNGMSHRPEIIFTRRFYAILKNIL